MTTLFTGQKFSLPRNKSHDTEIDSQDSWAFPYWQMKPESYDYYLKDKWHLLLSHKDSLLKYFSR